MKVKVSVIRDLMLLNLFRLLFRVIVPLSLLMGRQDQGKLIPWLVRRRFSIGRFISRIKGRGLSLGLSRSCGKKSGRANKTTLSRPVSHKYTISRSKIC